MSEMRIGDIGVLQNAGKMPQFNGCLAEIVATSHRGAHPGEYYEIEIFGHPPKSYNRVWVCAKHQIRPITDPDAEQETEKVKELVE